MLKNPIDESVGKSLRFENINKYYETRVGDRVHAVNDVSLDVAAGEFLAIVGASGCGKSTLLQIAAGFMQPSSGKVFLAEKEVKGPSIDRTMVFQNYALFPWLSVSQNVEFGLKSQKISKARRQEISQRYLELVGLKDFANKNIDELSGGMKQRVGIARALVVDPSIILMDEPFGALDALTRRFLQKELLRIWSEQRRTVIFVTHSVSEAIYLADRVLIMTSRPGTVKSFWSVDTERPRDSTSADFRNLEREIYGALDEELMKTIK